MSYTNPADTTTDTPLTAVDLAERLTDLAVTTVEQGLSNDYYGNGRRTLERQWVDGVHARLGQGISERTHEGIFHIAHLAGKGASQGNDASFYKTVEAYYTTLVETIQLAKAE